MSNKRRVFIIDAADEEQMKADLVDEDVKSYYWGHTGAVATYWMTSPDFIENFPGMTIPPDLALYDPMPLSLS